MEMMTDHELAEAFKAAGYREDKFVFNRPIHLIPCSESPSQYLARNPVSQFPEYQQRVERRENKMLHSKQQRAKARVRRAAVGRALSGITLNADGTWKRGTKKRTR